MFDQSTADDIIDQISALQSKGLRPGCVIVGTEDFETLMSDEYVKGRSPDGNSTFFGVMVVIDASVDHRADVYPESSSRTYHKQCCPFSDWSGYRKEVAR